MWKKQGSDFLMVPSRALQEFGAPLTLKGFNVCNFSCTVVHVGELGLKIFADFFKILPYLHIRFPLTAKIDGRRRRVVNSALAEHLLPNP